MFAFFGLGSQEIIILVILFAILAGAVIAIIAIVGRGSRVGDRVTALEQENQRMRDELDRVKDRLP